MKFDYKKLFYMLIVLVLFFSSLACISAADFDDGFVDEFVGEVNSSDEVSSSGKFISSEPIYLDSDTVFDEDFDGDFPEPLDDFCLVGGDSKGVEATKTGTSVVGSNLVKYYLNDSQLVFGLKDSNNHFLSNKPLKVYFSNKIYDRTTNSSGMSYLNINLQPGNYTFNVKFLGDSSYSASNKTLKVTVNKMPTSIVSANLVKDYGGPERLVATLKDAHGNPLTDKSLTVNITGVSNTYSITTNSSGSASLAINLMPQVTNATIRFSQNHYISSSKTIKITINTLLCSIVSNNLDKYYGESTPWTARLLDKNGNPLPGKVLNFNVCSGSYNRTTNSTGHASLNINFSPRNVTGTVSFSELAYGTVSKNVNILVKEIPNSIISPNVNKYYGESTPWTARLLDKDGNPLTGKTLNFQVSSGSYDRTTDSNGYASVNINFPLVMLQVL